jgi:hypothetical protein
MTRNSTLTATLPPTFSGSGGDANKKRYFVTTLSDRFARACEMFHPSRTVQRSISFCSPMSASP